MLFNRLVVLRWAVGIILASITMLVGLPGSYLYFDVTFVVVLSSLLVQGWSVALAARKLDISFARSDPLPRRVELDLPGQLAREIIGYPVPANSPFLRRGLIPNWARPTLVIRNEEILTPSEAHPVREGDYVYLLAPPENYGNEFRNISARPRDATEPGRVALARYRRIAPRSRTGHRALSCPGTEARPHSTAPSPARSADTCR